MANPVTTFRALSKGDRFEFHHDDPVVKRSLAGGPWVKDGGHCYHHEDPDHAINRQPFLTARFATLRVGSLNVPVIRLT